ncbi:hypothetical protein RND81_10G043800 [Saponaria officinalis]|uniref:Disease resistance R13L4/SHOC-2-like LRR domain-containing protein n=1 Tax=Saponaria officinalis TaxID=3572 RepID=A0AAW1HYW8_SAPOF
MQLNKEELVDLVMDPRARTVIPILTEEETGEPPLARLVFDDPQSQNHFSLLSWVSMDGVTKNPQVLSHVVQTLAGSADTDSVSEEDQCTQGNGDLWDYFFGVKEEDLEEQEGPTEEGNNQGFYKKKVDLGEQLQGLVSEQKCLLVLDNVSDQLIDDLLEAGYIQNDKSPFFPIFFKATAEGSKIIITSKGGSVSKHLQPLNHDNSWALFKSIALGREGEAQETSPVLLEIGLKIFRKCDNIPFVIKIIASILSTRHTVEEWEHFHDIVLAGVQDLTRVVLQTVADALPYCSLFPKDYEYKEDDLIAEYGLGSCFGEFLVKGYFLVDNNGGGGSPEGGYKMNYLTYDLMKYVAGHDYSLVDKFTDAVNHEIVRHVSFVVDSSWQAPSWLANAKQLKSLLFRSRKSGELVTVPNIDLSHLRGLRILDFGTVHCENLQYFLGELTNLAYLRLGATSYKSLPQSITVLRQLKTLNIRHSRVTALPTYFYEVKNLTCLYAGDKLMDMLPTLVQLKSLRRIDVLKVNENNWFDALALLKYITSIGKLTMTFENAHVQGSLRGHWSGLPNVRDLSLIWSSSYEETRDMDFWVPVSMLRSLAVHFWKGEKVPSTLISKLSNIVSIQIVNCSRCRCLPSFSTLPHLSTLKLWGLNSLEYIEDKPIPPPPRHLPKVTSSHIKRDGGDHNAPSSALYFRSLKYLILGDLPELKRWSKNENDGQNARQWSFPLLLDFRVSGCPQLRTMPLLPILESLYAINIHGKLLQHLLSSKESPASSSTLKKLHIISIHELGSISTEQLAGILKYSLAFLEELEIDRCEELDWDVNLNDPVEAWQGLKTLRSLQIANNLKLESLPRGCECFTTLEQLSLSWLYNLQLLPDWLGHLSRLRRLAIQYCSRLKTLPKSLGSLSALQVFEIVYCPRLRELPESFDMLTSLIKLEIRECPKLERRCQKPDGQDWPRIRHIPHVICVELPSPGNPGSYYS